MTQVYGIGRKITDSWIELKVRRDPLEENTSNWGILQKYMISLTKVWHKDGPF